MPKPYRTTGIRECLLVVILGTAGTLAHSQPPAATATSRITLTIPERIDRRATVSLDHCGEVQVRQHADGLTTRVEIQCSEAPVTERPIASEVGLIREVLVAPI